MTTTGANVGVNHIAFTADDIGASYRELADRA